MKIRYQKMGPNTIIPLSNYGRMIKVISNVGEQLGVELNFSK